MLDDFFDKDKFYGMKDGYLLSFKRTVLFGYGLSVLFLLITYLWKCGVDSDVTEPVFFTLKVIRVAGFSFAGIIVGIVGMNLNYRYLIKNKLTEPSRLKWLTLCIFPWAFLIILIMLFIRFCLFK